MLFGCRLVRSQYLLVATTAAGHKPAGLSAVGALIWRSIHAMRTPTGVRGQSCERETTTFAAADQQRIVLRIICKACSTALEPDSPRAISSN